MSDIMTRISGKVQTQPDGGEGEPKARVVQQCAPEGSWRQRRGSTNPAKKQRDASARIAPYREVEGRQMRRGMVGIRLRRTTHGSSPEATPPQGTKSSIRRDVLRISDPAEAGLKVAPFQRERPVASRKLVLLKKYNRTTRENRLTKTPASVGHRVLTTAEPNSARG